MSFEYVKNILVSGDGYAYPGGAADYESQLRSILDTIKGTETGKTVMGFFALRSHRVWIVPPDEAICRAEPGAFARPVDFVAAVRRGADLRDGGDGRLDPDHRHGSGAGSDSRILFDPIGWGNCAPTFTAPEVVIVHELFHAMRHVFGALRNTPMRDFKTVEELYSIFVQNMYATEKGLPLRADKLPYSHKLDHSMAGNPAFHAPMRDLFDMMPSIGNALARVNISYNPFQDWRDFSRKSH